MSNETTQKRSLSVSLGAAFLMATSAIGPGFLTQTSQFTAKYLSSFAFVIVCVIIMDMIAQTNVWSIVGVSGLRGQEIANKVLPVLGYLLVVLVVLGGLAFYIGNVGGSYLVMALACHIVPVFFLVLNFLVELTLLITKSCSTLKFLSIYSRELFRLNALFLVFEFFKVRRSRIGTKSYP